MVREETHQEINNFKTRHYVVRDLERYVRCIETQKEAKVGDRNTEAARRLNAKEVLTPMSGENLFSQSQMERSNSLEEIMF